MNLVEVESLGPGNEIKCPHCACKMDAPVKGGANFGFCAYCKKPLMVNLIGPAVTVSAFVEGKGAIRKIYHKEGFTVQDAIDYLKKERASDP